MSTAQEATTGKGKRGNLSPALEKAQQARKANAEGREKLSQEENFALRNVQQAAKACKMISARIRSGRHVPPEVLRACSTLAASISEMLYQD